MPRILKPGPRPIIAFSIMFGLLLCLPLLIAFTRGMWWEAGKMAACILLIYGLLCFFVSRGRIIVATDSIAFQPAFGSERRVAFRDITKSLLAILAEPDHPVALEIYCASRTRSALKIGLKSFRQEDVAWLLSLPELRVQR